MEVFLLFVVNGLFGYGLQAFACFLAIWAFNREKIAWKKALLCVALFAVTMFAVRNIPGIGFGLHTIFTLIAFIGFSVLLFKMDIYPTVLAVLVFTIGTVLCEALNVGFWYLVIGKTTFAEIMQGSSTLQGQLYQAGLGLPTNILLVSASALVYRAKDSFVKKVIYHDHASKKNR